LYRILCQIVQLAGRQSGDAEKALYEAAQKLRTVRPPLRSLMHPYDRERTWIVAANIVRWLGEAVLLAYVWTHAHWSVALSITGLTLGQELQSNLWRHLVRLQRRV
jgi:hypothetical protein